MKVSDIMTLGTATIRPDASLSQALRIMADHRISALPVLDDNCQLPGIVTEGNSDLFKWGNDLAWDVPCSVCKAKGFLAGDSTNEEVLEESYDDGPWEKVEIAYSADEFSCPVCGLRLIGQAEVEAGGYEIEHFETDERQIEYEPEYGNC